MLTKQEYYDRLVRAATDGTFPGCDPITKKCKYRGDNTEGCKSRCAIGILIPDEKYNAAVEDFSVRDVMRITEQVEGLGYEELLEIQGIHDESMRRSGKWKRERFISEINKMDCFAEVRKV